MFAAGVMAAAQPVRSGAMLTKMEVRNFTFVKAVDDAGQEFWVLVSICTIVAGGKIGVLAGTRYRRMETAGPAPRLPRQPG